MSFSDDVKKELCRLTCRSENEMRAEMAGMVMGSYVLAGRRRDGDSRFSITTEFPFLAARMRSVSKALYGSALTVAIQIVRQQRVYVVSAESEAFTRRLMKDARIDKDGASADIPPYFLSKQHYFKAYLRGLFLTCGSVSDPQKKYQLELNGNSTPFFENVSRILKGYDISSKSTGMSVGSPKSASSSCSSLRSERSRMNQASQAVWPVLPLGPSKGSNP